MNKTLLICVVISFTLTFFITTPYADEASFSYSGYLRNFLFLTERDDNFNIQGASRLRVRLDYYQSESVSWEFAYELAPLIKVKETDLTGSVIPGPPGPDPLSYRTYDLEEQLYPSDDNSNSDLVLLQNLDRGYASITMSSYDLFVGRQSVAFGSARVINPTDIIAPFTYNTLVKEERIGVDAVRLKIPTGLLGELDIGAVLGEEFRYDESAAFLRLKTYIEMTDFAFLAIVFRENYLLGLDVARSLGGAGTWIEAAHTFSHESSDEDYFRLSVGADYSFTAELYAYLEYHFNGAGRGKPEDYFDAAGETAYTDGAVYLLGTHYLAPGITYQLTPLLIIKAQALINLNDGSVLASPIFEYSLADDIYLEVGGYVGFGNGSLEDVEPDSEFGLYTDVYYAALNLYF